MPYQIPTNVKQRSVTCIAIANVIQILYLAGWLSKAK